MTEQELATSIFPAHEESQAAASIITGTALGPSSHGEVLVAIRGAQVGGATDGIVLPTTCSVAEGQSVVITLYGPDGRGKKGIVTGVVGGGSGGGGDIDALTQRVEDLEDDMTDVQGDITSLTGRMTAAEGTLGGLAWKQVNSWSSGNNIAKLLYQKSTGQVMLLFQLNSSISSGWNNLAAGGSVPADLRPGAGTGGVPNRAYQWFSPPWGGNDHGFVFVHEDGSLGIWASATWTHSCGGSICWLANADLNY